LSDQQDVIFLINGYNRYAIAVLNDLSRALPAVGHLYGINPQIHRPPAEY